MNRRTGRIQRDIEQISESPQPNIAVWPVSEKSVEELAARLSGPENSPFAGGSFQLSIKFPDRYPFEPPHLTFKTRIYHPNIDAQGRICLDLLKLPPQGTWRPHINLSTVLTSILLLMTEPNPNDPLDPEIAEEFKANRALFDQHARQLTQKYAVDDQNEFVGSNQNKRSAAEALLPPHQNDNTSQTSMEIERKLAKIEQPPPEKALPPVESKPIQTSQPASKKNPFASLGKKPKLN